MNELGHAANQQQLESWAFVVHRAMSRKSRDYHNVTHVFVVARGLPALERMAAIYHDTFPSIQDPTADLQQAAPTVCLPLAQRGTIEAVIKSRVPRA